MKQIRFGKNNLVLPKKNVDWMLCHDIVKGLVKIGGVNAIFLCGSKVMNCNNKDSDYDFFVVNTWNDQHIQTIHAKINNTGVDFILFPSSEFNRPTPSGIRIVSHLLRKYSILYCDYDSKRTIIKKYSKKLPALANEYEIESIWYWIWSSIDKARRYLKYDKELAKVIVSETYYYIGLFYGRLCGQECQGYSHSLKFMRKNHFYFWRKYAHFASQQKKLENMVDLIKELPNAKKFFKKRTLVELNGFISDFPMYDGKIYKEESFKKKIDKLVVNLSKGV